jgi:hypothetical protein
MEVTEIQKEPVYSVDYDSLTQHARSAVGELGLITSHRVRDHCSLRSDKAYLVVNPDYVTAPGSGVSTSMTRLFSTSLLAILGLVCLHVVTGLPTGCVNPMKSLSYRLGEGGWQ